MPDQPAAMEFHVEDHPDPLDIDILETQIRREASAAMGLAGEADLTIFVRDAGKVVAGISGWTWGDARALYERNGYELVGCVEDFPTGTDALWYRKRLNPPKSPPGRERSRSEEPSENTAAMMTDPDPQAGTP